MNKQNRDTILQDAMDRLCSYLEENIPPLCETKGMSFKISKTTKCQNEVWQKNFLCGSYSLLLHLNYSREMSYFSLRILQITDVRAIDDFTVETLLEERYQIYTTPENKAVFHSQTLPGEKYSEEDFQALSIDLIGTTFN